MAKRLKSIPDATPSGRRPTYPWDQWTDGGVWAITQGEDFNRQVQPMRAYLYKRAELLGLTVITRVTREDPTTIIFQFAKPKKTKGKS